METPIPPFLDWYLLRFAFSWIGISLPASVDIAGAPDQLADQLTNQLIVNSSRLPARTLVATCDSLFKKLVQKKSANRNGVMLVLCAGAANRDGAAARETGYK
ncbi:MAG: hypothetical protein OXE04_09035 [bacterium]|nr:hypothetical protein [bacterium]